MACIIKLLTGVKSECQNERGKNDMKTYHDELQVLIDSIKAYGDKYNVDTKQALIEVYALIPNKQEPMQEQKKKPTKKTDKVDYMDMWLDYYKAEKKKRKGEK